MRARMCWLHLSVVLVAVAGCATTHAPREWSRPATVPSRTEIEGVPFVAQAEYQCGPAALAMVLSWVGDPVHPDALVGQVYSAARQGSLPTDMTGAVRRRGLVAHPVVTLADLLTEIAATNPVIVLQNLGSPNRPRWHYAVVVGYDLGREQIILRSGRTRRAESSLADFERSWAASGRWALLVLPPRRLPATASERSVLEAVAGLERARQWQAAVEAYELGSARWPQSLGLLIGLGNSRYALNDLAGAERAFRLATRAHPEAAVAFNNLAHVLAQLERRKDALTAARQAAELMNSPQPGDRAVPQRGEDFSSRSSANEE